jgi:hypothetical protein
VRARIRFAAIVLAFACFTGVAYADGPGGVYNDFAQDGKLSCNHSRAALHAVLRSGSINQYGDPFTLARLKLAVRRQLAGGCRSRSGRSGGNAQSQGEGTTTGGQDAAGTRANGRTMGRKCDIHSNECPADQRPSRRQAQYRPAGTAVSSGAALSSQRWSSAEWRSADG